MFHILNDKNPVLTILRFYTMARRCHISCSNLFFFFWFPSLNFWFPSTIFAFRLKFEFCFSSDIWSSIAHLNTTLTLYPIRIGYILLYSPPVYYNNFIRYYSRDIYYFMAHLYNNFIPYYSRDIYYFIAHLYTNFIPYYSRDIY